MSDDLRPWFGDGEPPAGCRRPLWSECLADAARALQAARARRDALPARQAAEEAYLPGGPSLDDIEAQIRRHRQESRDRATQDREGPTDTSPPTG